MVETPEKGLYRDSIGSLLKGYWALYKTCSPELTWMRSCCFFELFVVKSHPTAMFVAVSHRHVGLSHCKCLPTWEELPTIKILRNSLHGVRFVPDKDTQKGPLHHHGNPTRWLPPTWRIVVAYSGWPRDSYAIHAIAPITYNPYHWIPVL